MAPKNKKLFNPSEEETQVIGAAVLLGVFLPDSPITRQAKAAAGQIAQQHIQNAATHVQGELTNQINRATGQKTKPQELKLNPETGTYE